MNTVGIPPYDIGINQLIILIHNIVNTYNNTMARGNQREQAREKNQKKLAAQQKGDQRGGSVHDRNDGDKAALKLKLLLRRQPGKQKLQHLIRLLWNLKRRRRQRLGWMICFLLDCLVIKRRGRNNIQYTILICVGLWINNEMINYTREWVMLCSSKRQYRMDIGWLRVIMFTFGWSIVFFKKWYFLYLYQSMLLCIILSSNSFSRYIIT